MVTAKAGFYIRRAAHVAFGFVGDLPIALRRDDWSIDPMTVTELLELG